ncbi:MAG: ribosomal protein L24P [Cenarchaeum symbiont of Oopsacas minuta]|nr:ribosomal protein L24P [Cenarchaeum symbiont of Oopsacas minuta]
MKPTKMRNLQIYQATIGFRSRQLASPLSKDLRKKYGKRSARVIEGDTVFIMRGEYKEISGKVTKSNVADGTIAVEGVKKVKGKGDKIDVMIHASNVTITTLDVSDKWRRANLEGKNVKDMPIEKPTVKDVSKETTATEPETLPEPEPMSTESEPSTEPEPITTESEPMTKEPEISEPEPMSTESEPITKESKTTQDTKTEEDKP